MENKKVTLSLCMIVKNEEEFLANCLESVRNVVDEMIIVDTGSTDGTVDIARRYNAKVYFHEWQNSFSEARNFALQFVTGDWVLQLDADEELVQEDIPLLLQTIRSTDANAVFVSLYNELPEDSVSKHYFPRLYRKGMAHYEGIVHNQLIFQGQAVHAEIRILHHGYNLDPEKMARKYERSARLLEKQLQQNPNYIFAWHNLIRIHRNQLKYDLVIKEAQDVLQRLPYESGQPSYLMIAYDAAVCAYKKGDYATSENFCKIALEKNPHYVDALTVYASILIQHKKYQQAIPVLHKALENLRDLEENPRFTMLKIDSIGTEYMLYKHIGYCHIQLQSLDKAEEALLKSLQYNAEHSETYQILGTLYINMRDWEKARAYFEKLLLLNPDHLGAMANLSLIYLEQGKRELAEEQLYRLSLFDSIEEELLLILGNLCVKAKNFKLAIEFYEKYLRRNPHRLEIVNNIANCYACQGHLESAIIGYQEVLTRDPMNQLALKNLLHLQQYIENTSNRTLKENLIFSA